MRFYNNTTFLTASFYVLAAILIATRILLIATVNIDYIDSDMPFLWAGVKDYSQGLFYEPRFYGQDYNTFMESLFAVPLYWCGVPVYYALPIATHFIFLFPFLFTAFYLFHKNRKENAVLVLVVLLCLASGYDIMTSLPRGINGIFFASFFVLSVFKPDNFRLLALNTLLAVLGYFVTPSSVVISVPFLTFLFLHNWKNRTYYFVTATCLLSVIPFYLIFDKFYKDHPDYIIYGLQMHLAVDYFFDTLKHLDKNFAHVSFLVDESSTLLLLIFLFLGIALFRKNKMAFLAYLAFISVILFSFFTSKVRDGVVWPFYSYSRMYIGVPMVIILFSLFFEIRSRAFITFLIVLSFGYSTFKFINFRSAVAYHTDDKKWNGIHLVPLSSVLVGAEFFKSTCEKNGVDHLLISSTQWLCTYVNYGGPVIFKDYPSTEESNSERRYWVRNANRNKVFDKFIFLSVKYDLDKILPAKPGFSIKRLDDYGIFLIENNTLLNRDFIAFVNEWEKK